MILTRLESLVRVGGSGWVRLETLFFFHIVIDTSLDRLRLSFDFLSF